MSNYNEIHGRMQRYAGRTTCPSPSNVNSPLSNLQCCYQRSLHAERLRPVHQMVATGEHEPQNQSQGSSPYPNYHWCSYNLDCAMICRPTKVSIKFEGRIFFSFFFITHSVDSIHRPTKLSIKLEGTIFFHCSCSLLVWSTRFTDRPNYPSNWRAQFFIFFFFTRFCRLYA